MSKTVLVYGTLRPGNTEPVTITGFSMFDLGWFPGIRPDPKGSVVCERVPVKDDQHLAQLDRYEGHYPDDPKASLYLRETIGDDYIYVYNGDPHEDRLVVGGDWLAYKGEVAGSNAKLVEAA